MHPTLSSSWIVMCAVFGCAFGLTTAEFVPYNLELTMLKSLPPGRLGSSVTCPDIIYQIPVSSYLDKLSSMIYLDVDYYSIVYNSTEFDPPVRGVLMTPGQGGSCYEDLGDLTDIMPTGDLKDQCSGDIYKDVIKTEFLMEGRTFNESCGINVYPNCSRPSDDAYCVPCVGGRCSSLYDCNEVTGKCKGSFDCKHPFTDPFCNTRCPNGTYGRKCAFNCGLFCLNGTCDPINGVCLQPQCAEGWSGPKCDVDTCLKDFDEEFWFNIYTFAIGSGIGIGIAVILMITCCFFCRYRMQTHSRPMNRSDYSQSRTEECMELSPPYKL